MNLKNIVLFIFLISNINFIFCKKEDWNYGIATEYGDTNGEWEVGDLEIGACNIDNIKKNLKTMYNINDYKDYIKFLIPDNDFKKNKDYNKKSQYFDPSSKTVALLDYKNNCGKLIELWHYKEDKNKIKTYIKGVILLVADQCKSCKNRQQVDLPFDIWNNIYRKEIYKIGKKESDKAPGEFDIKWRFFEEGENIKLSKL